MSAGYRVHHLNCACIQRLTIHGRQLACHCLLVETPADGLVLVDTGLGACDLIDPARRLGISFTTCTPIPSATPRWRRCIRSANSASTRPTCATS